MNKIMIIEDDPAILLGLKDLFSEENYEVITSADGKEGLQRVLTTIPDIVILDINLPNLNGLDLCRALREKNFYNPIVMLTARSEQVDKIVGLEIGADDYLTKPFDQKELVARVRALLRRSKQNRRSSLQRSNQNDYRRKLLTIMFTDIKDYSRKMSEDELMTLKLLKDHNVIMDKTISDYGGNIVETFGDGYLVSFESTIDAVECAQDVQSNFLSYNKLNLEQEDLEVRIGIHLGDVIEFENKLKGDVLNITARIQEKAPPGKIDISESVFKAAKNKINMNVVDISTKRYKNIKDPITIYTINVKP
ncbi:MAG: response regulator [Melioribacteraceae bacterium]|nr:response regulator [Melioribacteraceae bacterium]